MSLTNQNKTHKQEFRNHRHAHFHLFNHFCKVASVMGPKISIFSAQIQSQNDIKVEHN